MIFADLRRFSDRAVSLQRLLLLARSARATPVVPGIVSGILDMQIVP
jgi:hypothetical protein